MLTSQKLEILDAQYNQNRKVVDEKLKALTPYMHVIRIICEEYGVNVKHLVLKTRYNDVVYARFMSMYYIFKETNMQIKWHKLSNMFYITEQDHSIAIHGVEIMVAAIKNNHFERYVWNRIQRLLTPRFQGNPISFPLITAMGRRP
jgi:chromosomal replication initiation ATPase DnaA